jgi:hypothetical protein
MSERSSSTGRRLAAYAAVLVAVFGVGSAIGAWVGPSPDTAEAEAPPPVGRGVVTTEDGYRLVPASTQLDPDGGPFRFTITGRDGEPVTELTETHEKLLHLVVVNRELTEFEHVHPALATDGTWSVELPALPGGSYRAIADFWVTDGPHLALGVDLAVAGTYTPAALPEPTATVSVDGYDVDVVTDAGDTGEVRVDLTVRRGGEVVTELEPYLGAFGHLIGIHTGDLAYAHVHPEDFEDGVVSFDAMLPSEGRYGFFFDFQHDGVVHTAHFTFDQGLVTGEPTMEH